MHAFFKIKHSLYFSCILIYFFGCFAFVCSRIECRHEQWIESGDESDGERKWREQGSGSCCQVLSLLRTSLTSEPIVSAWVSRQVRVFRSPLWEPGRANWALMNGFLFRRGRGIRRTTEGLGVSEWSGRVNNLFLQASSSEYNLVHKDPLERTGNRPRVYLRNQCHYSHVIILFSLACLFRITTALKVKSY